MYIAHQSFLGDAFYRFTYLLTYLLSNDKSGDNKLLIRSIGVASILSLEVQNVLKSFLLCLGCTWVCRGYTYKFFQ